MRQFTIYQSSIDEKKLLKKNFVVRQTEFQLIMDALYRRSAKYPVPHELILGKKGSGKTTLLKRLEIEIEEKLKNDFIPVYLAEEQAAIYHLFDLWLEVIEELKCRFSFQTDIKNYSDFKGEQEYASYLYNMIHDFCFTQKKKIVLLLDNFDRIIKNVTDARTLLREILNAHNDIVIIAASSKMDKNFWQYEQSFYELFRLHDLEALTIEEIKELFNHWSKTVDMPGLKVFASNNSGKLKTVRTVTDASPRTIQFLIRLIMQVDYLNDDIVYFKKIVENVTPQYQELLNKQPPQLRKIILEMALMWEACNTKELTKKCKMESKLISANLKTLFNKGIVDMINTDKRNLLYRVSDRFFNMWLIMTQGHKEQKQNAEWLCLFLEDWYDSVELKTMTQNIPFSDKNDGIEMTEKIRTGNLRSDLNELPAKYADIVRKIDFLIRNQNLQKALELANSIQNEKDGAKFYAAGCVYLEQGEYFNAENCFQKAIERGQTNALFNLGVLYHFQEKHAEAEQYYLKAINNGQVNAMINLGAIYKSQGKLPEAEKYYLLAMGKGDVDALINLGILHFNQNRYSKAENYFLQAIEKGHFDATIHLGNLYRIQGKSTEAEKYYLSAIEKGNELAMYNLGVLYHNQKKYSDAEKYYLPAIEKGNAEAMYNLGVLYHSQNKFSEAEKLYLRSVEKGNISAIYNLGVLYHNQNKFSETEKQYLILIEKNQTNVYKNLSMLYYQQNIHKSKALKYVQQYEVDKNFQIIVEIWNGIYNDIDKRMLSVVSEESEVLCRFIVDLLIHQQKKLVMNLFNHPEAGRMLQAKLKILHYVCLMLNKNTENNLNLRIPPEIAETISEVMNYIIEKEKFYGYKK